MSTQSDVDKLLLAEIAKLRSELLALKVYVASIPNDTPLQAVRNAFPRAGDPEFPHDMIAAAHKALDQIDGLAGEFKENRRRKG